jgi:acyl transferase domain-containing protein
MEKRPHSTMSCGMTDSHHDMSVAIIGAAGRFPGASTLEEFWENLQKGVMSVTTLSDDELRSGGVSDVDLSKPNYIKAAAPLSGTDLFDADFFNISAIEAEYMDPQHRIFLECALEALESAGCDPSSYDGAIGVFAGAARSAYQSIVSSAKSSELGSSYVKQTLLTQGNNNDYLSSRVSYKLNLHGPSIAVQSACSTSLVAVHLACQSLLSGECDLALAGGVSIQHSFRKRGYLYLEGGILSPDGRCRPFDAAARGTVFGDGVGLVALKRLDRALADGDRIRAVIRGSAVNSDGSDRVGFTAPSVNGQAAVISEAMIVGGVDPETIGYVEAHGTGTELGDPVEVAALAKAFQLATGREGCCWMGSVKSNIGHLNTAAGIASLIKAMMAVERGCIPPTVNFREPNPRIELLTTPFRINTKAEKWDKGSCTRRAGVSSFGIGGTNAHVVIEEAPSAQSSPSRHCSHALLLSARTVRALEKAQENLSSYLMENGRDIDIADVAFTLGTGRMAHPHRRAIVCRQFSDALGSDESARSGRFLIPQGDKWKPPVYLSFPGEGGSLPDMAQGLIKSHPVFRREIEHCAQLFSSYLGTDLRELLFAPGGDASSADGRLRTTSFAQYAMFAVRYALAKLLIHLGVRPDAMIGYGVGELVIACLAGVFSIETAVRILTLRESLMADLPRGAMSKVALSDAEIGQFLIDGVSLATIDDPSTCTLSGPTHLIEELESRLAQRGIAAHRLCAPLALHSPMMQPAVESYAKLLQEAKASAPAFRFISSMTGNWITPEQAIDPRYWARQLTETANHAAGVRTLLRHSPGLFVEVGSDAVTAFRISHHEPASEKVGTTSSLLLEESSASEEQFLRILTQLWVEGVDVDWTKMYEGEHRTKVPLPTYPFERRRYWAARPPNQTSPPKAAPPQAQAPSEMLPSVASNAPPPVKRHPRPSVPTPYARPRSELEAAIGDAWADLLDIEKVGIDDDFFALGGHSLLALQLIPELRKKFGIEMSPRDIFEAPTVAALVARIAESKASANDAILGPTPQIRDKAVPVSFAQEHMLRVYRNEDPKAAHNITHAVRIAAKIDVAALERSVKALIVRHEALRTHFEMKGDQFIQVVDEEANVDFTFIDLVTRSADERMSHARRIAADIRRKPFDVWSGPMIRVGVCRLTAEDHLLIFVVHHLISDAWSIRILTRELAELYGACVQGKPPTLPPLLFQYADFAIWQRKRLQGKHLNDHLGYWTEQLAGAPLLELPTDRPRPSKSSYAGARAIITFSKETSSAARELANSESITLFMLLFAAFAMVLSRRSGQSDIVIGTPLGARDQPGMEKLIGYLTNTIPLRIRFPEDSSLRDVLKQVRNVTIGAFAHQAIPLVQLESHLNRDSGASENLPLFRVVFAMQNVPAERLSSSRLDVIAVEVDADTARRDLTLFLYDWSDRIQGVMEYSTDLFDAATIDGLLKEFEELLERSSRHPAIPCVALVDEQ